MDDLARHRALFATTERYAYLNHAGLSPVPSTAVARVHRAIADQAAHGLVRIEEWEAGVERVRGVAARLMGCGPDEVAFVRNTSHGLSLVAAGLDWRDGDNVLCATSEEYPSNVYPWQRLARRGVTLRSVPAEGGRLSVDAFAAAGDARTRVVTVSSVQYATGFRTDLAALGQLCTERGWRLCVDGIQSLGAIPCDVKAAGVHFLSADAHKWLLGPAGVGVFFVDRAALPALEPTLVGWRSMREALNFDQVKLDLRDDAAKYEEGTLSYALIEGMGASMELLLDVGIERVWARIRALQDHLAEALRRDGHTVGSPTGDDPARSGALTFRPRTGDPEAIAARLGASGVVVACRRRQIRVSPHFYNTVDEIDRLVAQCG
jgi:cysteine desulfurase/selenocysteine lyase